MTTLRRKATILCVDDDPDILDWMKLTLSARGFNVLTEESGAQALLTVPRVRPDLILLDLMMPDLNGYAVCAKLQEAEETSCVPVVFVTSRGEEQDKIRALQAGAADYLVKPTNEKDLVTKVNLHLGTGKRWREICESAPSRPAAETKGQTAALTRWDSRLRPADFALFKERLAKAVRMSGDPRAILGRLSPSELYANAGALGLSGRDVAEAMSQFLSLPYSDKLDALEVRLGVLPIAFCRVNHVVPVTDGDAAPMFVLSNPFKWDVQEAIRGTLERRHPPKLLLTEPANVERLLAPRPAGAAPKKSLAFSDLEALLQEEYAGGASSTTDMKDIASEMSAPIIQLVNNLIETAYARGASDIHIEPTEEDVMVRYRVDGDLMIANRLKPPRLIHPIVARLKVMSNLDIAEHRLPQDGRIKFKQFSSDGKDFDLRLAVAPMNHGEKAVMRILDKQKSVLPLVELGLSPRNLEAYRRKISTPYGMILHVGPTGSGKSMTLYAALNEIKNPSINIHTAEDPIEYTLPGINQLQIHKAIGLTFARALRSFLRLDPDVILVGEIRDLETAEIAVEASLTGHLLLSTLHTNDAASTITRLVEMGIQPYLVSSSILLVCAQRLLRRLCKECKRPYSPDLAQRRFVGAPETGDVTLYQSHGCSACNQTGYRGRIGIHEILVPDDDLRAEINKKGVTTERLKQIAVGRLGMTTLFWDAMEKVRDGLCSVTDAMANVSQDEFDSKPKWMAEAPETPARRND